MSDTISKIVYLLLWCASCFGVLAMILLILVNFAKDFLHVKFKKDLPESVATVCVTITTIIAVALAILGVIYGSVCILTKGV